jgi:SAM-dependent methyltransferase
MLIKTDTDNLLHANPSLYAVFEDDNTFEMARFAHALLKEYGTGKRILDVGSGLGREVGFLCENGYEAVGIDVSREMIAWAQEHYPSAAFHLGKQTKFALNQKFDAVICVGSTFLYNYTNADALATLRNFRKHLHRGGILYLDMRNAAFFLTKAGQKWLTEELVEETMFDGEPASVKTRFSIDLATQILERDYNWRIGSKEPVVEHLRHRLFFPQELAGLLTVCSFEIVEMFDKPEPHISHFSDGQPLVFEHALRGRRMQVVARAV